MAQDDRSGCNPAALIFPQAFAARTSTRSRRAGVIKIGTEGTYAPFTFHNADNKLVGFDVEIGEAVAAKLGVKAEFVEGKWDGLIAGLDANRYDAVINQVGITEARKGEVRLLRSLYRIPRPCCRQERQRRDQELRGS